jgi:hypothetical protein
MGGSVCGAANKRASKDARGRRGRQGVAQGLCIGKVSPAENPHRPCTKKPCWCCAPGLTFAKWASTVQR